MIHGHSHEELSDEEILKTIKQALRKREVRWTSRREIIVNEFIAADRHLTAEELHDIVRKIDSGISTATVYRTMNMLVEAGMAEKRHFKSGSAAFDLVLGKGHHHHLIDVDSGDIIEFNNDELEEVISRVTAELGYKLSCHKIELFGRPLTD